MTEDEMIGWHHRLEGHEFEQVLGVADGQGSLTCRSPWALKESATTEQLDNNNYKKRCSEPLDTCFFGYMCKLKSRTSP